MRNINRHIVPTLTTLLLLALGLLAGCAGTTPGDKAAKISPTSRSTPDWGSHWHEANRLHRVGEFYAALLEYDKALVLMPADNSMIAFGAGMNIDKGQIYLMLFNGWKAQMCSQEAHEFLEQASEREKQGVAWNTMASQSLLIGVASLIYIPDNKGNYPYGEAKRLLGNLLGMTKMPEVRYFLGVVNDKLGNKQEARSQFEAFLSSSDILVTFTSKDTMRQRAKGWLEKP